MSQVETFEYRASRATRISVGLRMYMALSMFIGAPVLLVGILTSPRTIDVACVRDTGRCTANSQWVWVAPRTFSMSMLAGLEAHRGEGHRVGLAWMNHGKPNYWGGETRDPSEIAAIEACVARLRGFASGTDPEIHVAVPTGTPAPGPMPLFFMFLFGLLNAMWIRRAVIGSELAFDREKDTLTVVVRRRFAWTIRRTLPRSAIRGIFTEYVKGAKMARTAGPTTLALDIDGEELLQFSAEYTTPATMAKADELSKKLGAALGVPVTGT